MLTDKQIRSIRIYYQYGYSYAEIAEATDTNYSDIRRTIKNFKEEIKMGKGTPITPETKQKIIEMKRDLATHEEITTALNVSRTTVSRVLSEAKRKEPASAATDTDSEQNIILDDSSVSIITENSEDVKPAEIEINDTYEGDDVYRDEPIPPRKFAQITINAIWVRIGCQQEYIKHLSDDMDKNFKEIELLNKKAKDLDEQMKIAEDELEQLKADYKCMGGEDFE